MMGSVSNVVVTSACTRMICVCCDYMCMRQRTHDADWMQQASYTATLS
jgi:hypothetical protein